MAVERDSHRRRRDGGRAFGFAVIAVLFGIILLIVALVMFGSAADGEPSASIELGALDQRVHTDEILPAAILSSSSHT